MYKRLALMLSLALLPAFATAAGLEQRLSDQVFFVPDPSANSIQFQMVVRAGCADEANGCRGLAHYLEHLVLVGRNAQNTDQAAMRFFADGSSNGWTTAKATGYLHQFPAKAADAEARLEKLFGFYAARLQDFAISPEDAIRERNVVMQEYDWRMGSSPTVPLWLEANRFLYDGSPLGQPPSGLPADIAAFRVEDAKAFHAKWYHLPNVSFIISGPVDAELVRRIADKHLSPLPKPDIPLRTALTEPLPLGKAEKAFAMSDKRIANLTVAYAKLANFREDQPLKTLAVTMLVNEFLRSKISGSPHSVLVEQDEVALEAYAVVSRIKQDVLQLYIGADPEDGVSAEKIKTLLSSYSSRFLASGLDGATLKRLKQRYARSYARDIAEAKSTPQRLISWLTLPMPYESMEELPKAVEAVTEADILALLSALAGDGREASLVFSPAKP